MKKIKFAGLELIKHFEGLHLKAYLDPVNIPTIGYGHIRTAKMGQVITEQEATAFLQSDVGFAEDAVNAYTTREINQNQFDALVSFTFNLGAGALKRSHLLKFTNEGNFETAAKEFERWVYAGGEKLNGLVRRRIAERDLYLTPVVEEKETEQVNAELLKAVKTEIKNNSERWNSLEDEQTKLNKRNNQLRSLLGGF